MPLHKVKPIHLRFFESSRIVPRKVSPRHTTRSGQVQKTRLSLVLVTFFFAYYLLRHPIHPLCSTLEARFHVSRTVIAHHGRRRPGKRLLTHSSPRTTCRGRRTQDVPCAQHDLSVESEGQNRANILLPSMNTPSSPPMLVPPRPTRCNVRP